jgi:LmbE family N-acetylglucosaminyl deacetylase
MAMMTTAGQILGAAHSFPFATLDERLGSGGLVVVAPHPDDESLACGGLIAEACAAGRPTYVIVVSDGAGSHPASSAYPPNRLRGLREREARCAVGELGLDPGHIVFLGLPDRQVPSDGLAADKAIAAISECATQVAARAMFVSWRHDPHCDHQASYRIARAVQQKLKGIKIYEYTVWGSALPPDTPVENNGGGFRISIDRARMCKQRAIAAHRSQTTNLIHDDPGGFRLTKNDLARFAYPYEFFFEGDE